MKCVQCGTENREGARFCDNCGAVLGGGEGAGDSPAGAVAIEPPASALAALAADAPAEVGGSRFEVIGFLGEGTRKRVYLTRDHDRYGALTAVAIFNTEGMGETALSRARLEAEAMAKLGTHPHLVPIVATGQDGRRPFIASEYMPGGDLDELLSAAEERRLPVERALGVADDIAAGLEHAHRRGIVHRDLKPANVWLDSEGRARLGDFGLATGAVRSREAVERMVVGTAAYLPPEQAIGRRADERADLYSLGAVLYEMVTGQPPFPGDDPVSIISGHLSAEPVPPSRHNGRVPPPLDELVLALLAKSPDERPRRASHLRTRLSGIDPEHSPSTGEAEANPIDSLAAGLFVGRDAEFEALRQLGETALAGRGGAAMIEGEPGIGKTRLAEELITYARVRGALVLSAACHEADAMPAYYPFSQAIRAYIREADPVGLAWQLGSDGPELARLIPELTEIVPSVSEPEPLSGEESRFRFYDAVAGFLVGISASRPLVLVFDDLHWADSSSIELLSFLASRVSGNPFLLACAYREDEAAARPEMQRLIADIDEVSNHSRTVLGGLDSPAIARYFELSTGRSAAPELVARIHEQTGGNPFFVGEVVRLLADESSRNEVSGEIPHGVREAVRRRLERLPDGATEVLEAAAVIGREFSEELLVAVCDDDISVAVEAARAARIIEPRRRSGGWLFAHAVFRETLYEELDPQRRRELHLRAGRALEEQGREDPDRFLPALARHFLEAGPGYEQQALAFSLAAGRQAASRLAHSDAADHLERALSVLPPGDPATELDLQLELIDEMIRSGRFIDARATIATAAAGARALGDTRRLAEAAIAFATISEAGAKDLEITELIEEALEAVGDSEPALRAHLLVGLTQEYYWEDAEGYAHELCNEAVAIARELGDDGVLAHTLVMRQFLDVGEPGTVAERLVFAEEVIEIARRAGDRLSEIRGHAYWMTCQLQIGEIDAFERGFAEFTALAERLGEPRHLWHVPTVRAMRAIMRGNFAEAKALSREGARLGELAQESLATQFHTLQMALIHSLEGTPEEMLPSVRPMVARFPGIPAWRLALIGFLVNAGRLDDARVEYEPLAATGFANFPKDANWIVGLARISDAASTLGDLEGCRILVGMLEDYSGEAVVVGRSASVLGPIDRFLGMLKATLGEHDAAIAYFEGAIAMCERMGERPIRADTRSRIGAVLLDRDRPGDREAAFEQLTRALEEGQELGMRKLVERCVRLRLEAQGVAGVDVNASIDSVALAVSDERPDLGPLAAADGRVTILFSDIENSTLMTERLGDTRWIEVLREHNEIFRSRLAEYGGYEVKSQGDGFMLAFPDPGAALDFAISVQRDFAARDAPETELIRVRMGMHVGEVIEEGGDFFGRSVILAARIAAQARGGEVLISDQLYDSCGERFECDEGRELELKGLTGAHRVYAVEWEAAEVV